MNKLETIRFLNKNHQKLREVVNRLAPSQLDVIITIGNWTVKDILAHISAWNLELIMAIDYILENEKPWFVDEENLTEAQFNQREVEKRKPWSFQQVRNEWYDSYEKLANKIDNLSNHQWNYQPSFVWKDTTMPVSIESMLSYTYKGDGHEGGHAKQIEDYFTRDK